MNKEEEYHKARIAFAIVDDSLEYIQNDKRSHSEWLKEDFGIENYNNIIRGNYHRGNNTVIQR